MSKLQTLYYGENNSGSEKKIDLNIFLNSSIKEYIDLMNKKNISTIHFNFLEDNNKDFSIIISKDERLAENIGINLIKNQTECLFNETHDMSNFIINNIINKNEIETTKFINLNNENYFTYVIKNPFIKKFNEVIEEYFEELENKKEMVEKKLKY